MGVKSLAQGHKLVSVRAGIEIQLCLDSLYITTDFPFPLYCLLSFFECFCIYHPCSPALTEKNLGKTGQGRFLHTVLRSH